MAESSLTVSSDMAQKENFVIEQRSYKKTFYAEHKTVIKQVNNKTEHVQTSEPRANAVILFPTQTVQYVQLSNFDKIWR